MCLSPTTGWPKISGNWSAKENLQYFYVICQSRSENGTLYSVLKLILRPAQTFSSLFLLSYTKRKIRVSMWGFLTYTVYWNGQNA